MSFYMTFCLLFALILLVPCGCWAFEPPVELVPMPKKVL